jgi:hypothetical protein
MGSLQAERGGCTSELMNNLPRLQTKASRREDVVISVAGGSCDEDSQAAAAVAATNVEEPEEEQPLTPLGRMFLEPELELFGLCTIGFQNLVDLAQLKQHATAEQIFLQRCGTRLLVFVVVVVVFHVDSTLREELFSVVCVGWVLTFLQVT